MAKPTVAWRARPGNQEDVTSLIDFLEWSREVLKTNDAAELLAVFHPETGAIEFQVTQLSGKGGPIRKIRLGTHTY